MHTLHMPGALAGDGIEVPQALNVGDQTFGVLALQVMLPGDHPFVARRAFHDGFDQLRVGVVPAVHAIVERRGDELPVFIFRAGVARLLADPFFAVAGDAVFFIEFLALGDPFGRRIGVPLETPPSLTAVGAD